MTPARHAFRMYQSLMGSQAARLTTGDYKQLIAWIQEHIDTRKELIAETERAAAAGDEPEPYEPYADRRRRPMRKARE